MAATLTGEELAKLIGTESEPLVLDVREPEEFGAWSIPGSVNVPLGDLGGRVDEFRGDRPVVTVCGQGHRSAVAARALRDAGLSVMDLVGGMAAWAEVYDEVEIDLAGARIVQLRRRAKGCLSYLVAAGGEAFAVDPSRGTDRYLAAASARGWTITRVFDTHLHADHLSGACELVKRTGASLHLNPADPFDFAFTALRDGERFPLSGRTEVAVTLLATPGHTEGSTCLVVGDAAVMTGDTLFVDGVGRPDLAERAEEFAHSLYRSLRDKLLTLPEETLVLPAHYGEHVAVSPSAPVTATLGMLRAQLAALSLDERAFVAWATQGLPERPPNYQLIVEANRGRREVASEEARLLESGPNRCSVS